MVGSATAYEYGVHEGVYLRKADGGRVEVLGSTGWTAYGGEHGYRDWFERRVVTAEEVNQAEASILGEQS